MVRKLLVSAALLTAPFAGAQDQATVLELKNQIIDIQNEGKLDFKELSLCSKVIGFGSYVPLEKAEVSQGAELLVYYEPINVFTNRVQGRYEIWYTQDIAILSGEGEVLYDQKGMLDFHYFSRSPVFDLYATNNLNLGSLPPGRYTYRAVLKDRLKDASVEMTLPFRVVK